MYEHFLLPTIPGRDPLSEESIRLARSIHAPRTLEEYASDWAGFVTWCAQNARNALPAADETVARYVTDLLRQGRKIKTAKRHLSALVYYHRIAGCESPVTAEVRAIIVGAQPDALPKVEEIVLGIVRDLGQKGPTEQELLATKSTSLREELKSFAAEKGVQI